MVYEFICQTCGRVTPINMSLKDYENRGDIKCLSCNSLMQRYYSPINFKLSGMGWSSDNYGVTEREMSKNRNDSLKLEDVARKNK